MQVSYLKAAALNGLDNNDITVLQNKKNAGYNS